MNSPKQAGLESTHPSLQEPSNTTSQENVKKWNRRPGNCLKNIEKPKKKIKKTHSRACLFRLIFPAFCSSTRINFTHDETPPPRYPSCKAEQNYKFFGYRMIFYSTNQNELHNTNYIIQQYRSVPRSKLLGRAIGHLIFLRGSFVKCINISYHLSKDLNKGLNFQDVVASAAGLNLAPTTAGATSNLEKRPVWMARCKRGCRER